jgi:PAS domain S-box-containing protein
MSGNTVLLVEDNPTTRKLVRFSLERAGYVVVEAADAKSALELLDARSPSLILLDLVLPDADGLDVASEMRARTKHRDVSILAFSGFISRQQESRMSAIGFDDIVTKPIEPSRLVQIVSAHLPLARAPGERFGAGRKLIIADDDPFQLKLTRFRLARLGFDVHTAQDGKRALELARTSRPDAIISDVMMPELDGFGLVLALRDDPALADVPIVLVTSSYVEPADRTLAQRAGANDLVVRSPDLEDLIRAIRDALETESSASVPPVPRDEVFEADRAQRTVRQLEREVLMNAGLARRCASLSAELAILAGISDAMLAHRDLDSAIDEAISACFDAGGISVGALYLLDEDNVLKARTLGGETGWKSDDVASFFGRVELLRDVMTTGRTRTFSASDGDEATNELLARCGGSVVLAIPLVYAGQTHGAMVMVARGRELDHNDWRAFSQGVGNQITQALALAAAFRDRERAERRAYEQATLLQHVLDSIAEGVVVTNAEGRVMVWNAAAERIVPLTPEGEGNERWAERYEAFLHTDGGRVGMNKVQLERALQGEKTAPVEIFVAGSTARDGSWVTSHSRPLSAGDGTVRGSVTVMKDVTESRRASLEVLASRARWQALVEHAPDFVLNIDHKGIVRFINRVVPGLSRSDIVGHSWLTLVPSERWADLTAAFEHVLETGDPATFETVSTGPDGGVAWYASHLGPIRQGTEIVGAVLIARDITQKKQTEAQLIVSDRLASVGTLAAGVAHEINNPLASVIANIEVAIAEVDSLTTRGINSNEAGHALRDARDSASRVRRIVRDLNIFSRSDDDGERGPVSAENVLESTLRIAWNDIRHRARLVRVYAPVPNVLANESRLGQVFLNLLVNAAHAIPDGAVDTNEIRVSIDLDGTKRVVVTITDTGCGIPEAIQKRMFTPFLTTKPAGIGTGLGLSICHRIVTASGGELTFDSSEGVGTTFKVFLPIATSPIAVLEAKETFVTATRRAKVLVIDDEEIVARAVRRTLQEEHDITLSLGARPALAMLDAGERFDLILCDLMMPDMTGMDFYEALEARHLDHAKRIVFLTGGAFTPRAREFLDRVACPRIEKPFDRQGLRSRVNELIT